MGLLQMLQQTLYSLRRERLDWLRDYQLSSPRGIRYNRKYHIISLG